MCKGCIAHLETIRILQTQLDRTTERANRLEGLLFEQVGLVTNLPKVDTESVPIPSKTTWSELGRKLEARDLKKLRELQKVEEA